MTCQAKQNALKCLMSECLNNKNRSVNLNNVGCERSLKFCMTLGMSGLNRSLLICYYLSLQSWSKIMLSEIESLKWDETRHLYSGLETKSSVQYCFTGIVSHASVICLSAELTLHCGAVAAFRCNPACLWIPNTCCYHLLQDATHTQHWDGCSENRRHAGRRVSTNGIHVHSKPHWQNLLYWFLMLLPFWWKQTWQLMSFFPFSFRKLQFFTFMYVCTYISLEWK